MQEPVWIPSQGRIDRSNLLAFQKHIERKFSIHFADYKEFHRWSVEQSPVFWSELLSYFGVRVSGDLSPALSADGFDEYNWFPNLKLNFAENLLLHGAADSVALNFQHESAATDRQDDSIRSKNFGDSGAARSSHVNKSGDEVSYKITYAELRKRVASLQVFLQSTLHEGDVLAAFMPNTPETVVAMLTASSLGAVFTSTSADFGVEGVLDRFSQSNPKVLVAAAGYEYNGKYFDNLEKIRQLERRLPSLEKILIVDFLKVGVDLSGLEKATLWSEIPESNRSPEFKALPFSHPLYIMYSSGTTGKPKCIVHSAGGTLLQHIKELALHSDLTKSKRICFFTTCGWMMWNWLVSSLYFGSEVVLYEGSPGYPTLQKFFEVIEREQIHIFGTSPKFLKALEDTNPEFTVNFNCLETILSTGSPLLPEQFDFVYKKIKNDVLLASISGGTDIIGCFMLGNPTMPVYRGEIQCCGLGMDVAALNDQGVRVIDAEGELVCGKTFPSRPIYFLNDHDREKIGAAYFERYPGYWHHGDFVKITSRGGVIVYGRSDATLNPGGVRIGTAEIYRQTESLSYIADSLCVGKSVDGDVEILLFVKLKDNEQLSEERIKQIKDLIRQNTTPRHVPRAVYQVSDIPYTRSGKKMELAIARVLNKKPLTNLEAISNPECLKQYEQF